MKTLRIVLVEDEPGDATLIRYSLKSTGYADKLQWVQSLSELAELQTPADVILLDLNLPDSSGIETVKRCKSLVPNTAIVVLTGHDDMDFSLKTLEAGSQDYLVKNNLDVDTLIRAIRYAIERHQLERQLQRSQEFMTAAIEGGNLGLWEWNFETDECNKSDQLLATLGFAEGDPELTPDIQSFIDRIHPEDQSSFHTALDAHLAGSTPRFQCEFRFQHKAGHWPWLFISGHVISWDRERPVRMVGIQQDITERKAMEAQLTELAMRDPLTGLLNRRSLIEELNREYGRVMRHEHYQSGLLMLDIDHFKRVNDTYGHNVGDIVLKKFGQLIQGSLRENDVFGRLGGEEFAILLPETDQLGSLRVGEKVRKAIEAMEITSEDFRLKITTSVGVACLRRKDSRPDGALIEADDALYQAKKEGRNRVISACNCMESMSENAFEESQKAN